MKTPRKQFPIGDGSPGLLAVARIRPGWHFVGAVCAFLWLLPASGLAFEGWEHEALGTMSLIVGSNHVSQLYAARPDGGDRFQKLRTTAEEFGRGLRVGTNQTEITFGTIVKLVDYMKDPYNMTHQSGTGSGWLTNTAWCI